MAEQEGRKFTPEDATAALSNRVLLLHYFPIFREPSDPAYEIWLEEAEKLREANPAERLAQVLLDLRQEPAVLGSEDRTKLFTGLLNTARQTQSGLRREAKRRQLVAWGMMNQSDLSESIFIPVRSGRKNYIHLASENVDSDRYNQVDDLPVLLCPGDGDAFTALRERRSWWKKSQWEDDIHDVSGDALTSPMLPTVIDGVSMQLTRYFSSSTGEPEMNTNFSFYITKEVAEIAAKAPMIEIPDFAPTARVASTEVA